MSRYEFRAKGIAINTVDSYNIVILFFIQVLQLKEANPLPEVCLKIEVIPPLSEFLVNRFLPKNLGGTRAECDQHPSPKKSLCFQSNFEKKSCSYACEHTQSG